MPRTSAIAQLEGAPPRERPAWDPRYTADEIALGVAVAFAVLALFSTYATLSVLHLLPKSEPVATKIAPPPKSVISATLRPLGRPLDRSKLPDRIKNPQRPAPPKGKIASQEDPLKKNPLDAGPPPPEPATTSPVPQADASAPAPDGGTSADAGSVRDAGESVLGGGGLGGDGGLDAAITEPPETADTDPDPVHAGVTYAVKLDRFMHAHMAIPSSIPAPDAVHMCAIFEVTTNDDMVIVNVRATPHQPSGNDTFDQAMRAMLEKLQQDQTKLPIPPVALDPIFRGREINVFLQGNSFTDPSKCKK